MISGTIIAESLRIFNKNTFSIPREIKEKVKKNQAAIKGNNNYQNRH